MPAKRKPSPSVSAPAFRLQRLDGTTDESGATLGPEVVCRLHSEGSIQLLIGGSPQTLPPARLAVHWRGTPHQVLAQDAVDAWQLTVPLAWLRSRKPPGELLPRLLRGQVVFEPDGDHFACDREAFTRWSADLKQARSGRHHAFELELEARLWRLAVATAHGRSTTSTVTLAGRSRRATALGTAAYIAAHHTKPLKVGDLGLAAGLHPTYLNALFSKELGHTPFEHLVQHRLSHALRLLLTTRDPVLKIATRSGFGSVRRLNVVFREVFGEAPLRYRQLHS